MAVIDDEYEDDDYEDEPTPCDRCGTYAELEAWGDRMVCQDCVGKLHPIERTPPSVAEVLSGVMTLLFQVGPPGAVIVIVLQAPMQLLMVVAPDLPTLVQSLYDALVGIVGVGAVLAMADQTILDGTVRPRRALRLAYERWTGLITTQWISGLVTMLFTLLLIVPGILKALSYTMVLPIALHEGVSGSAAMARSEERMKGHRGAAFGAYLVTGLIFFACAVGYGLIVGFSQLDGGGPSIAEVIIAAFLPAMLIPTYLVSAVFHAKLRHDPTL